MLLMLTGCLQQCKHTWINVTLLECSRWDEQIWASSLSVCA